MGLGEREPRSNEPNHSAALLWRVKILSRIRREERALFLDYSLIFRYGVESSHQLPLSSSLCLSSQINNIPVIFTLKPIGKYNWGKCG